MRIERDDWLAHRLGCPALKVVPPIGSKDNLSQEIRVPLMTHRVFYYAKIPVTAVQDVQLLTSLGFVIVDTHILFTRRPDEHQREEGRGSSIVIRTIDKTDNEKVLHIAETCFRYSRFHLDPQIPNTIANHIKREWIKSYLLRKRGNELVVATSGGQPVGFLAVLATEGGGERIRVIDLIGVDQTFQGQGVGRKLVQHFVRYSFGKCTSLQVGTQLANAPSLKLYESCGFRIQEASYILHGHFGKTRRET